jgi:hypothetical protein
VGTLATRSARVSRSASHVLGDLGES